MGVYGFNVNGDIIRNNGVNSATILQIRNKIIITRLKKNVLHNSQIMASTLKRDGRVECRCNVIFQLLCNLK